MYPESSRRQPGSRSSAAPARSPVPVSGFLRGSHAMVGFAWIPISGLRFQFGVAPLASQFSGSGFWFLARHSCDCLAQGNRVTARL